MGSNQEFGEMGNSGSLSSATDHRFAYASRELEDLRSFFDSPCAVTKQWKLRFSCSCKGSQIPQLLHQDHIDPSLIVLKKEYAWHFGGALPPYELEEWKLLYHSVVHGLSYSTFFDMMDELCCSLKTKKVTSTEAMLLSHGKYACAVNFSSDSIPDGIGFGGRVNHFGLFISASFDQGHTFPCTTFDSPFLSKTNRVYPRSDRMLGTDSIKL